MSDELRKTVKIVRKPKVVTDERGQRVWAEPVEEVELELVSTMQLQAILESDKAAAKKIVEAADRETDDSTVLAHDADKDSYEFVDAGGNDDFSLVSTQMLFKMLEKDNPVEANEAAENTDEPEPGQGFDPYNSG